MDFQSPCLCANMRNMKKLFYSYYSTLLLCIFYVILNHSVFGDETSTARIVFDNHFGEIINNKFSGEYNPFGYFFIVKIMVEIFGENNLGLRILSLCGYLVSLFLVHQIIWIWFKKKNFSHLNSFVLSFLPLAFYYSTIARGYSCLLMFCLLNLYWLLKMYHNQHNHWHKILYVLSLSIGLYFHYFLGLFLFILFLCGLCFLNLKRDCKYVSTSLALTGIGVILFIPEFITFLENLDHIAVWQQGYTKLNYLLRLVFVIYGFIFGETLVTTKSVFALLVALAIFFLISIKQWRTLFREKEKRFCLMFIVLGALLVSLNRGARPMYLIFALPFFSFLLSSILDRAWQEKKYYLRLFMLGTLILFFWSNSNWIMKNSNSFISPQATIDYPSYFQDYVKELDQNDLLLVSPSFNDVS